VFSPILGRYYAPSDRLTTCLADHLVSRVRFADAVQQLHAGGVTTVIECGALDALTKLAKTAAPAAGLTAVSCLSGDRDEAGSMDRALDALAALGKVRPRGVSASPALLGHLVPAGLSAEDAEAFWRACGDQVRRFLDDQYAAFRSTRRQPAAAATPAAATVPASVGFPPVVSASGSTPTAANRAEVFHYLTSVYAAALEYPQEVFTEDVELEGELGIDSVKQTELLARVSDEYGLPPRPADFRLSNYDTLGKVTDFVFGAMQDGAAASGDGRPFDVPVALLASSAAAAGVALR
jgi:acyl carrier protein